MTKPNHSFLSPNLDLENCELFGAGTMNAQVLTQRVWGNV